MLKKTAYALKDKNIRHKLFFTLLIIIIIRAMCQIPVPGVKESFFKTYFSSASNDAFSLLNAFTGGGFEQFSILALSVTPYITSSIIIQLMSVAVPGLEEMTRDGEDGRKKLERITRITAVCLAVFESAAMCIGFRNSLIINFTPINVITIIFVLTAGSCTVMTLGDMIDDHGIGNGISVILLVNILSRTPQDLSSIYGMFIKGKTPAKGILAGITAACIITAIIVMTLILNNAEITIPVQYARRIQNNAVPRSINSGIPIKVNTSGVIAVIFASSVMTFPGLIISLIGIHPKGPGQAILSMLSPGNWFNPADFLLTAGFIIYAVLVILFAYFYTTITFNPAETADNLKKQSGIIPGIRPGKPTEEYLSKKMSYIVFIGAAGLLIVCTVPLAVNGLARTNISLGGTSLIIIVSVILETADRIDSMTAASHYKGFLTKGKKHG